MKKIFLVWLLQSMTLLANSQKQPVLVKATRDNAADYWKKAAIFQKKNRPVYAEEQNYSFEKVNKFKSANDPAIQAANSYSVMVKPELTAQEKPQVTMAATARINSKISGTGGPDPMPAVGEKTILVGNTGWMKFFDKATGEVLLETDANALFWRFLSPVIPGTTTPNPDFASNFYNIPTDIPLACSKSKPCGVDDCGNGGYTTSQQPCNPLTDEGIINEAYDIRLLYQKEHKRFVVIAALRNQSARDNNCYNADGAIDCAQYLIRLVAVAVSVSEDPSDGFHIYRTGENNYRDWPNAVVDKDYLVISNKGGGPLSNGTSIATVYSFVQMKDGAGPVIDGFTVKQNDNTGTPQAVVPVGNVLTNQNGGAIFFLENKGSGKVRIWYIKKPNNAGSIFQDPPSKLTLAGQLVVDGAGFEGGAFAGITYFDNCIYMTSYQSFYPSTATKRVGFGLNIFRIPVLSKSTGGYEVSSKASDGFQHFVFKNENYSYMDPSIAVDGFKNIVIQFVRLPRNKNATEKPQIRAKVKFSQEADFRASVLLKEWGVDEPGDDRLVHYSWVVKDPFHLSHFWMAHKYKSAAGGGTWLSRLDLNSQ
jgi:hypothetical protein